MFDWGADITRSSNRLVCRSVLNSLKVSMSDMDTVALCLRQFFSVKLVNHNHTALARGMAAVTVIRKEIRLAESTGVQGDQWRSDIDDVCPQQVTLIE